MGKNAKFMISAKGEDSLVKMNKNLLKIVNESLKDSNDRI